MISFVCWLGMSAEAPQRYCLSNGAYQIERELADDTEQDLVRTDVRSLLGPKSWERQVAWKMLLLSLQESTEGQATVVDCYGAKPNQEWSWDKSSLTIDEQTFRLKKQPTAGGFMVSI